MQLATIKTENGPSPAIFHDGQYFPISQMDSEVRSLKQLIEKWDSKRELLNDTAKYGNGIPHTNVNFMPPVMSPEKVICIGQNYADHASEMGSESPTIPVVFNKFPSALIADGDEIELPPISDQVDYEAELVVVIGQTAKNVSEENAIQHVFGYTCGNDISARDWQKGRPGGQWLLGKTFDTFAPCGPNIVTADEVGNAADLKIEMRLNGETMQSSCTEKLIFSIPFLISHISKFVTLQPGDLLFTGTPSGVGAARDPQVFLQSGDTVEVEIERVGLLKNFVV